MKIKLCTNGSIYGDHNEEIVEVDDDTPEEELEEMAEEFFWNCGYEYWWRKVEDDDGD